MRPDRFRRGAALGGVALGGRLEREPLSGGSAHGLPPCEVRQEMTDLFARLQQAVNADMCDAGRLRDFGREETSAP